MIAVAANVEIIFGITRDSRILLTDEFLAAATQNLI